MSEIEAALLCAQFEKFPEEFERRRENAELLRSELAEIDGIVTQPEDGRITARAYESFAVNYDPDGFGGLPRDDFVEALEAEGVPVSTGYGMPLTEQPAMAREHVRSLLPDGVDLPLYRNKSLPGTEEVIASRLRFSHRYLLADSTDIRLIPQAIRKIRDHADEISR